MRSSQHGATIPSSTIFGGAARRAVGNPIAVFLGDDHLAVGACLWVGVDVAAGPSSAETARGGRDAGKVGIVGGRAWAGGWGLKGRGELRNASAQLERRGLVIEAVVGEGRKRLF